MPQETNLNVAPYFDDFDATKNYNKVLFKPAYPIQARELNNIQSILQGQIEAMGDNLFKEGSVVIPGNSSYKPRFHCVQIQSEFLGVPVNLYLENLVGKKMHRGKYNIVWKGDNMVRKTVASGIYLLMIKFGGSIQTKNIKLIK